VGSLSADADSEDGADWRGHRNIITGDAWGAVHVGLHTAAVVRVIGLSGVIGSLNSSTRQSPSVVRVWILSIAAEGH